MYICSKQCTGKRYTDFAGGEMFARVTQTNLGGKCLLGELKQIWGKMFARGTQTNLGEKPNCKAHSAAWPLM